jgi:hypothetical protein
LANLGYRKDHRVIEKPGKEKSETVTETRDSETWSASYSYSTTTGADLFRDNINVSISGSMTTVAGQAQPERRLRLEWREFFRVPTPEGHQLAFRMSAGWSDITTDMSKGKAAYYLGSSSGPFLLRGFKPGTVLGQYMFATNLEYRFRILDLNKSVGAWPYFLDDLGARPFIDMAMAGEKIDLSQTKISFGLELRLTMGLGYFNQIPLRFGIAQGLGEKAPTFYFDALTSF